MIRAGVALFILMVLLTSGFAQQNKPDVRPGISPLPLWPLNGDFPNLPPDQYVFLDPQTNEWVVSYPEDPNAPHSGRVTLRFDSHAAVEPVLLAHVSRQTDGTYSYEYTVLNSSRARTPLKNWTLLVPTPDEKFQARHSAWLASRKDAAQVRDLLAAASRLAIVEWGGPNPIPPGGATGAFTLRSGSSPGFTTASFSGLAKSEYSDQIASALPRVVADQVAHVLQPAWDSQVRMVLGPRFPVGTPQIIVVDNFHFGISVLAQQGILNSESPFVKDALATLRGFLSSGGAISLTADRLDFLTAAVPGLESEIASALRLSLAP
jgi:hypothetical protein